MPETLRKFLFPLHRPSRCGSGHITSTRDLGQTNRSHDAVIGSDEPAGIRECSSRAEFVAPHERGIVKTRGDEKARRADTVPFEDVRDSACDQVEAIVKRDGDSWASLTWA